MRRTSIITLTGTLCLFQLLFAQIDEDTHELSAYIGVMKFSDHPSEPMVGIRYSYNFTPSSSVEGSFGYSTVGPPVDFIDITGYHTGRDANAYLFHGNYRHNFVTESERFTPFLSAGVGYISLVPETNYSVAELIFNVGAGFLYSVTNTLSLRSDLRDVLINNGKKANFELSIGMTVTFI